MNTAFDLLDKGNFGGIDYDERAELTSGLVFRRFRGEGASAPEACLSFVSCFREGSKGSTGQFVWKTWPTLERNPTTGWYTVLCEVAIRKTAVEAKAPAVSVKVAVGEAGWRARKGPQPGNLSGFAATGHRLLLEPEATETTTDSGIILASKTVQQDKARCVWAIVLEIGHDAWSDKSTDFCDVGDKVLVGEYTGKFHTSPVDGKEYRFINDLDVITPLRQPK